MNIMKTLLVVVLLSVLAACASTDNRSKREIYGEVTGGIEHTHVRH